MSKRFASIAIALALPLLAPEVASANSKVDTEVVRHSQRGQSARATDRGHIGLDVSAGNDTTEVRPRGELLDSRERSLSVYYDTARTKTSRKTSKKRAASKRVASRTKKRRAAKSTTKVDTGFDALSCLDGFGGETHAKASSSTPIKPITASANTGTRRRVSRELRTPVRPGL